MKKLAVLALITLLTACGTPIEIPDANAGSPKDSTTTSPTFAPASNSGTTEGGGSGGSADSGGSSPDTTVNLTYYSKTRTIAPNSSFPTKTYTATGNCTVYEGSTYCWDDGKKTVVISGFNFYYSYFNMSKNTVGYSHSSGGMQADLMVAPTIIGIGLTNNMAAGDVDGVLNTGAATSVSCTLGVSTLDCGSFSIDLDQVAL